MAVLMFSALILLILISTIAIIEFKNREIKYKGKLHCKYCPFIDIGFKTKNEFMLNQDWLVDYNQALKDLDVK